MKEVILLRLKLWRITRANVLMHITAGWAGEVFLDGFEDHPADLSGIAPTRNRCGQ
jgi:hypothetical protein